MTGEIGLEGELWQELGRLLHAYRDLNGLSSADAAAELGLESLIMRDLERGFGARHVDRLPLLLDAFLEPDELSGLDPASTARLTALVRRLKVEVGVVNLDSRHSLAVRFVLQLSQPGLAEKLGIPRWRVVDIEHDNYLVRDVAVLRKFAPLEAEAVSKVGQEKYAELLESELPRRRQPRASGETLDGAGGRAVTAQLAEPSAEERELGARLETSRAVLLLTRAEVAARAQRSEEEVLRWEAGTRRAAGAAARVVEGLHAEALAVVGIEGFRAWHQYRLDPDRPAVVWPKLETSSGDDLATPEPDDRPHVGRFLAHVIETRGASHADLVRITRKSKSAIKNYVYGLSDPPDELLAAVIDHYALDVTVPQLLANHSLLRPERRKPRWRPELEARKRGARIRASREVVGLELRAVGERVAMTKHAVHLWEMGKNQPPVEAGPALEALEKHAIGIIGQVAFESFAAYVERHVAKPATTGKRRR